MKLYAFGGSFSLQFLCKEKLTKIEMYGQDVVVRKSYLDICSDKLQKTKCLKKILALFFFTKLEKTLPWGAFAVWGSASGIAADPKVAYEQDLGLHSTSCCIDKNSVAIFRVSWKKVFTGISDNGLNRPNKSMMLCVMTQSLFFHDVLRFDSNHFLSKTDLISSRSSFLILLEGTRYLKGTYPSQPCVFLEALHHVSQNAFSAQDTGCYRSDLPQLPENNPALHSGYTLH